MANEGTHGSAGIALWCRHQVHAKTLFMDTIYARTAMTPENETLLFI